MAGVPPFPTTRWLVPAALLLAACGSPPPEAARPPVVLIVFDAFHAGHVGHLGYPRETTPHLDALAADGVSFRSAFSPAPYTLAGIPTLLTGRLPDRHGLTQQSRRLSEAETTIAEMFEAAGYQTLAAVSNVNGAAAPGNAQGFERFDEMFRPGDGRSVDFTFRDGSELHIPTADEFADYARVALEKRDPERPLFLYLHVLEPHSPYTPPDEYRYRWLDRDYDGRLESGESLAFVETLHDDDVPGWADVRAGLDMYDANIAWADENLGRIVQHLRDAELYDEALIVVTSDHGEAFWQHGQWGHNDQLYDEMLRVPLVVKLPGPPGAGRVVEGLASTVDVLPSLAEWVDLPLPGLPLDGQSLAGVVAGTATVDPARALRLRTHHETPHIGLRTADAKTIVTRAGDGRVVRIEHYELRDDPTEENDVARARRGELERAATELRRWFEDAEAAQSAESRDVSEGEQGILEQLGYGGD